MCIHNAIHIYYILPHRPFVIIFAFIHCIVNERVDGLYVYVACVQRTHSKGNFKIKNNLSVCTQKRQQMLLQQQWIT